MRTTVRDAGRQFDRQTHAYAEYRMFSRLTQHPDWSAGEAQISLARIESGRAPAGAVLCTVALTRTGDAAVRVHALGRHAYAAIDRAAALLARALVRRARVPVEPAALAATAEEPRR
jgi:hypothetical protein